LGIASELGCFDIDGINGLVLVGFELTARVGMATIAVGIRFGFNGSTVYWDAELELYVRRKLGFRITLEASRNRLGFSGLVLDSDVTVATLDTGPNVGVLAVGINDSTRQQVWL